MGINKIMIIVKVNKTRGIERQYCFPDLIFNFETGSGKSAYYKHIANDLFYPSAQLYSMVRVFLQDLPLRCFYLPRFRSVSPRTEFFCP